MNEKYAIQLRKVSNPPVVLNVDAADYAGTDEASVTIRQDTDSGIAYSFGNSITFYNAAYRLIVDELANSPTAPQNHIEIYIFDKCCKDSNGADYLIFKGLIRSTDIQLTIKPDNERCAVECDFSDYSATSEAISCLKQTVIFSNSANGRTSDGENEGRQAVYYNYYEETRPSAYMFFLLFVGAYLYILVTLLLNILTLGLINFFGGALGTVQNTITNLFLRKRFHKAPFLASYLRNACKLCGLQLQSSIFATNGFFENVTRLDASTKEGGRSIQEADTIFRDFNAPNITAADLLNSLRDFNVRYWIENGNTLVVERKDYQTTNWIDFSLRDNDIGRLNLKVGDSTPPAIGVYEFINDQSDKTGQEVFRQICGYAIDFNTPTNPAFRGVRKVTFPYGAWRTIDDGGGSVLADIPNTFVLNQVYTNSLDTNSLIMQTGVCLSPKLLEYDTATDLTDAKVFNLNKRFYINTAAPNQIYVDFLAIDDPRIVGIKNKEFELTFIYNCDDLRDFAFNKTVKIPIQDNIYKVGDIDSVTFNFNDGTATINGKV